MSFENSLLSRQDINAEKIANALFVVSEGNKNRLTSETALGNPEGIWGRAVKRLYPEGANTFLDRKLVYSFWRDRRKFVEVC